MLSRWQLPAVLLFLVVFLAAGSVFSSGISSIGEASTPSVLTLTPTSPLRATPIPTNTPRAVSILTPTPASTPWPSLTVAPSPLPDQGTETAPAEDILVADFENGARINNLAGMMGVAYRPGSCDSLLDNYSNGVVRLEYHLCDQVTFWMVLQKVDFKAYTRLSFKIRADVPIPQFMKVEIKLPGWLPAQGKSAFTFVSGITAEWQTVVVDLSGFIPLKSAEGHKEIVSTNIDELAFIFTRERSGVGGVVYLDDVLLLP